MNPATVLLSLFLCCRPAAAAESAFEFGRLGRVAVYRPAKIERVAVFISGDGGWNLGVVDMAVALTKLNTLVLGVDITKYMKVLNSTGEACAYPAADFEALSQFAQKDLGLPGYIRPALVGYSSGATLVYAALGQAPPDTFAGALSLGFCPDLPMKKPMCKGSGLEQEARAKGGYDYLPARHLANPWVAFQGLADKTCFPETTEAFVKDVRHGDIVLLPKVGHGFGVQKNWMPQFTEAFERMTAPKKEYRPPQPVSGLPLVELPLKASGRGLLAVIVSGDGGWAGIDREVAGALNADGVPVVGLDSLKYFWTKKTPETAGADLARILAYYLDAWKLEKAAVIGYSRGADVAPFMVNRLPAEQKEKVALLAMLAPARKAEFEFHVADWISSKERGLPIKPEVEAWQGRTLCFYGKSDKDTVCLEVDKEKYGVTPLGGGHHFGGAYKAIAQMILDALR